MKRIHVLDITLGLGFVLMAVIASAGPGGEHWQTHVDEHPEYEHRHSHSGPRYVFGENKALTEAMQREREAAREEAAEFYYILVNSASQARHIREDPYLALEANDLWVEVGWVNGTEDEEAHWAHIEHINGERAARGLKPVIVGDMRW